MSTSSLMAFIESANADWDDVRSEIRKIYNGPPAVLSKVTRFGGTTSFSILAKEHNDKLLLVVPTNKIHETISEIDPTSISIYGHKYCQVIQQQEDDLLKELPLSLPSICPRVGGCEVNPDCKMTQSWYETANTRIINYQKLVVLAFQHIINENSEVALLRNMLSDLNIVVFDESHEISLESSPSVNIGYQIPRVPLEYENLRRTMLQYQKICMDFHENLIPEYIQREYDYLKSESYLSQWIPNDYHIDMSMQSYAFAELKKLAKNRAILNLKDDDIRFLLSMIGVMSCHTVSLNLTITSNGEQWTINGKPTDTSPTIKNAIKIFLREVCPNAKVFFMSGTQFEKYPGFYEEITGYPLENICIPDVKHTNSLMAIIPSSWSYSSRIERGKQVSTSGQIKRIKNDILDIMVDHPCEPIYIICFNKILHAKITKLLKKYQLPEGSLIDYYRSSSSQGIKCEARIGIAIGIANTPTNVFDFATNNLAESQALRLQGVHAATWQAWSRIKDPMGKVPSIMYCVGVRTNQVDAIVAQGSQRNVTYNGKGSNGRHIPPTITFKEELPRPNIQMESKTLNSIRPCKMSTNEYIDSNVSVIEHPKFYDEVNFVLNHLYNVISEKVRFLLPKEIIDRSSLKIYNKDSSDEWLPETFMSLKVLLTSREDKCGLQNHRPNYKGDWGYNTGPVSVPFDILLYQHFSGIETIALPPFSLQDTCYFVAVDLDDHDGTNPQDHNILAITKYLVSLNIPHFAIRSGSNTGCHIIIPLLPCPTYTAYKFIRQILSDLKLNGRKDIEPYPKQKSAKTAKLAGGYGNQIKLPIGFNWKVNKWSTLIDSQSLQPIPFVEISHVLKLRNLPDLIPSKPRKPKVSISSNDIRRQTQFRQCIRNALQYQLSGSDGNDMRVCIASEGVSAGLDREAIIELFEGQEDFDYETTAGYVDYYISNNYHAWNCSTIQEKCSAFVNCMDCLYKKQPKSIKASG